MSELKQEFANALLRLESRHRHLLEWFQEHAGEQVAWSAFSNPDFRLASLAKGIYKPSGMKYTLSVKQTLASPYADSTPAHHEEGGWLYQYHQEDIGRGDPIQLSTNRSLTQCMRDDVPVGVIIQLSRKPEPTFYRVWGLAFVRYYMDGVFLLEGLSITQPVTQLSDDIQELSLHKAAEGREPYGNSGS
jgi:hypothetical protein